MPVHKVALVQQVEQVEVAVVHERHKRTVIHKLQANVGLVLEPGHKQVQLPQRAHEK